MKVFLLLKAGIIMENMGYLQKIMNIHSKLKGAERKVADYILENPNDIIHLSITELAYRCSCGEATISRFSKKLGYKGFQELKIKVAGEVVDPILDVHEEIKEDDDIIIIMQKVFNSTINSLKETLKINDYKNIEKAVEIIWNSERIVFYGMGGSSAIALDAYHKFLKVGKNCIFHSDSHFEAMISSTLTEKDCILAISNTGSNKDLVENIEIAKMNKAKVISITSNLKSPVSNVSDIVLVSYGRENELKSEAVESRISSLALIDCIFVSICLKDKENYFHTLRNIREAIASKRY